MNTLNNIQINENKNGMSQVIIDLRPQVKRQDGHGREVLADVHFRIDVRAYSDNLYTYTQEAREESNKAVTAFDREIVELLTSEGWTLKTENYGPSECPELVKGTQYLYCHPQDISGQVAPADIETLEAKIKAMTACKYRCTDNYGDIIVTTSEADEKQLYRDTYADGLAAIWQEVITTKRSNLYKDKGEAKHCVRRRICIANRRADLNDIGTGSYNMRNPLLEFLMEEYDRLLKDGYIKEAEGANGRTLCRWINKREEKERAKAIREAEKAAKAKAEAEAKADTLEATSEITNSQAEGIKVGDTVRHNKHEEVATVTAIREAFVNGCDGYRYLYTLDFSQSVTGPFGVELNGGEFLREAFTPCTPDGRELLPEWLKAGATVYSTKMWMYGDPFTIDGPSTTQSGCWHMTAPDGFTFSISPEDIGNEFATVAPAPHDKQGREVPQPELHIGDRVILGEFFKTDKPNTDGTIWGKEWDEGQEAWTYRIRVAECVYYHGRADQVTPVTPLEQVGEITDTEAAKDHEPTLYERHNITAGEREAKAKGSALYIRRQAHMASYAFYSHKGARIETSIAYRNGTDDPDGMSYKVCWYDETRTGELHLVECENGISLEQAARHMADFALLSECGLTLREILYPAA